ncbi:ribosomal RNA-processing protein RRP4 [Candidatus Nanobsidianus stetteri]|uniref:Ribosomal RNA-processing protein RRP4 n=1 Tax=Nanobsidianus stetteri TaxID=1294122 RepID=R1E4G6_NANST|nr:ribosomal RNA-processing protein RRP4 [Candidatus Nanobsidianus stetteri]
MILIPGDNLKKKDNNSYERENNYYSKYILLVNEDKTTKLFGYYMPEVNDIVIGKVIDVLSNGWLIDINSPYMGKLSLKDVGTDPNDIYTYGDYILCQIVKMTKNKLIDLDIKKREKLNDGLILKVDPARIPRVIGKNSSMLNLIKQYLKVDIIIGKNGRIYLNGDVNDILKAVDIIRFVINNSYKRGLTEKVKEILENK